ncbi:MAG: ABC transporter permease subunit [Acetobacteraceae bacterium]
MFRGVPLLVQLLVIYYLLPFIGLELPSFLAGALGLALCTAAYQAENLRGGFQVIPRGQAAAARAFGYCPVQTWRHILLPQAFARGDAVRHQRDDRHSEGVVAGVGRRRGGTDPGQREHCRAQHSADPMVRVGSTCSISA